MNLAKKETWTELYKEKLLIEIVHWGVDRESGFSSLNNGKGVWNYYISISERFFPNKFPALWLEDKKVKFTESSPVRIIHDYSNSPIANLDWHRGVTFYNKLGQVEGHRCVKFGCDYAHLWDMDRCYNITLEEIYQDCIVTAEQILQWLNTP